MSAICLSAGASVIRPSLAALDPKDRLATESFDVRDRLTQRNLPEDHIAEVVHPNGASSTTSYDALGRTAQIVHRQHGVVVATLGYEYDRNGNRTQEVLSDGSGTRTTTYECDADDRLTAVEIQHPNGSIERGDYVLDGVGNRLRETRTLNGVLQADIAYAYDSRHRITERSDAVSGQVTTYEHDDNGHLIEETSSGSTTTYRPNVQDRLATLTLPGAPPVRFAYDAEGKRVERRSATEVRRFGWDGTRLRRETNATNNTLEAHDWAAGRLLRSQGIASTCYAQHDALASPTRWSRSDGGEQGRLSYDAWGVTTSTGADLPRIAYTGHYLDSDTGDYYAQQRYYRPGLGRFNRVDPWEGDFLRPVTLNKYLYANGNPLIYVDPDGRIAFLSDWQDVTSDAVASYERDIERATQEGAGGRAFLLGIGKGLASIGDFAVTGLNTTSNLLARNLYDGDTYAQAQREIESNQQAMSQAIESVHRTAVVVQEDPTGAAVAVKDAAIAFSVDVAMGEPRAMAALGEFTGQLVVPGAGAKGLKVTGESLDTARSALRMGDGFIDAGMADDLAAMSRGAGRAAEPSWVLSPENPAPVRADRPATLRQRGFQDHHIISDKNPLTQNHELLDLAGYNLQSRPNKIFLPSQEALHPTRSIDSGRHRNSVSENLANQMDTIVDVGRQQGLTQEQFRRALDAMVSQERQLLRSGERALNRNARPWAE